MKKLFLLIVLGLFFASPSLAAEFYIDAANGNDSDAGTEAAPWKTLSMISGTNISSGDIVYLKGDFTPTTAVLLDSTIQGSDYQNHTVIRNWEGESPTIKLDATLTNGMFYVTGNNYTISGLEFHNNGTYLASSIAVNIRQNQQYVNVESCTFRDAENAVQGGASISFITVEESTFYDNEEAIFFHSGENMTIMGNEVYDNTSRAIMVMMTSTNNVFANNLIYNNTGAVGIYPGSVNSNVVVMNNTIVNNNYGVACEGYGDGVLVKNNIISESTTAAIAHYELSPMVYDYNLYYGNANMALVISVPYALTTYSTFNDWQALGFDEHSLEGDPSLDSDYHLQDGSPAIDAGLDVSDWIENDIDGNDRPWGDAWDIGADEYQYLIAPTNPALVTRKVYQADLAWDEVNQADSYEVRYRKGNATSYETTISTENSVTLENLVQAGKYFWQVKAVNGAIESDWSTEKRVITYPRKVLKSEYRVKEKKRKQVKIQIDSMEKRITGFNVLYYKKVNGKWKKQGYKKIANKSSQNYSAGWITGLKPDTKYKYRVKARRVVGSKKFLGYKTTFKYFTTLE